MLSWHDLATHPKRLPEIDIAEVNLICAAGLPGTEQMDVDLCMSRIADMTERVREHTERLLPHFRRDPARYDNSESFFRVMDMVTVLQRDNGIKYNPAKVDPTVPLFPVDSFIFGIFQGDGGTCASLPVLYTSVGRRLGYPIKLVSNWDHLLCRWEYPNGERFNIEAAGKGLSSPPDQYYREGMYAKSADLERKAGNLLSFTPQRELAGFLRERASYWCENSYFRNGVHCQAWAAELDGFEMMRETLYLRLAQWDREHKKKRFPIGLREIRIDFPARRFSLIPKSAEARIYTLGLHEDILNGRALPHGQRDVPSSIHAQIHQPSQFLDDYPQWKG